MNIETLTQLAFEEDIREGDITSNCIIDKNQTATAKVIAKQKLILCGIEIIRQVLLQYDPKLRFKTKLQEGQEIEKGIVIATIEGNALSLLACERIILNFLQRLSGIATNTKQYTEKIQKYNTKLLDTRKTIPGYRAMEKYAVKCGGGMNHRQGLYDMVLIKDNHIAIAGSIKNAILLVNNNKQFQQLKKAKAMKIEVEVQSLQELKKTLQSAETTVAIDIIMLDNFSPKDAKIAVELIQKFNKNRNNKNKKNNPTNKQKQIKIEASGGINLENIEEYAKTGIDYISIGSALTLSSPVVDINIDININNNK